MPNLKVEMKEGVEPLETQKPEVKVEPKTTSEPKYVRLEDLEKVNQAINNTREYNNRQLQEIKNEIARLAPKPISTGDPDLDELVQTDWKAAVEKVTERVLQQKEAIRAAETESQQVNRLLEEAKLKVMNKHPELSDPDSAKAKEFLKVLDENPDFRTNPRGPLLAAYEMENRLKGHDTVKSEEKIVVTQTKETRSKAASVPAGTPPSSKQTYTLSKQDLDFCRLNGINPENYKRYKGKMEARA